MTYMPNTRNIFMETGSRRSLAYCIKASSEDTSETSEVGEVFSGLKEKVSQPLYQHIQTTLINLNAPVNICFSIDCNTVV